MMVNGRRFECASCHLPMTHGEWKKLGALKRVIAVQGYMPSGDYIDTTLHLRYCSKKCFVANLIEEHECYGFSPSEIKRHLKEGHGIKI